MNDSKSARDQGEAGKRGEHVMQRDQVREALEKAIKRADQRSAQADASHMRESSSKADAAMRRLRENRRLSREELDRPATI